MKKLLVFAILVIAAAGLHAQGYTVINYHQPGIVEAVGRTAVGLTYGVGATAVGLTQAATGLVTGYDRTVVVPNQPVYYQQPVYTAPAYVGPTYVSPSYGYGYTAPVVYQSVPAVRYCGGNIYYTAF